MSQCDRSGWPGRCGRSGWSRSGWSLIWSVWLVWSEAGLVWSVCPVWSDWSRLTGCSGRSELIDKDHSSTWSTTSPATPRTLALLPASAAGYFQALYHTDDGLLKALHHVPAYLLEFSSNHWISPSPSASTQRSSSPTSPRLNFQRAAPKSPVLSPSLKDTYVFYTSKFQLQGPRTPASSLSQSQRAAPSHIGPRSAVINAFRLQNYLNGQSFYLWHCAQGELSQDPEDSQRSAKFRSWMILTALDPLYTVERNRGVTHPTSSE